MLISCSTEDHELIEIIPISIRTFEKSIWNVNDRDV